MIHPWYGGNWLPNTAAPMLPSWSVTTIKARPSDAFLRRARSRVR